MRKDKKKVVQYNNTLFRFKLFLRFSSMLAISQILMIAVLEMAFFTRKKYPHCTDDLFHCSLPLPFLIPYLVPSKFKLPCLVLQSKEQKFQKFFPLATSQTILKQIKPIGKHIRSWTSDSMGKYFLLDSEKKLLSCSFRTQNSSRLTQQGLDGRTG